MKQKSEQQVIPNNIPQPFKTGDFIVIPSRSLIYKVDTSNDCGFYATAIGPVPFKVIMNVEEEQFKGIRFAMPDEIEAKHIVDSHGFYYYWRNREKDAAAVVSEDGVKQVQTHQVSAEHTIEAFRLNNLG